MGSSSQQREYASHLWTTQPASQLQVPRSEKAAEQGGADHHLGADPHPQGAGCDGGVAQQLQLQPQCQHAQLPGRTASAEELSSIQQKRWCVSYSANPAGIAQPDYEC